VPAEPGGQEHEQTKLRADAGRGSLCGRRDTSVGRPDTDPPRCPRRGSGERRRSGRRRAPAVSRRSPRPRAPSARWAHGLLAPRRTGATAVRHPHARGGPRSWRDRRHRARPGHGAGSRDRQSRPGARGAARRRDPARRQAKPHRGRRCAGPAAERAADAPGLLCRAGPVGGRREAVHHARELRGAGASREDARAQRPA